MLDSSLEGEEGQGEGHGTPKGASMKNEIQHRNSSRRPSEFNQTGACLHRPPSLPDWRDGLGGDPRGAHVADSFKQLQAMQLSRSRRRSSVELIRRVP